MGDKTPPNECNTENESVEQGVEPESLSLNAEASKDKEEKLKSKFIVYII